MKHTFSAILIAIMFSMISITAFAQATEHCPDHNGHPGKVEVGDNFGPTLELDEGTVFCVKAATLASGKLTMGESGTYTVTWLNKGGQTPGISYYIIYESDAPPPPNGNGGNGATEEPTEIITETPTEEATEEPTVVEATEEVTEEATEEVTEEPVEEATEEPTVADVVDEAMEELPVTGLPLVLAILSLFTIGLGTAILRRFK